jgi:oligoendopeptidase F
MIAQGATVKDLAKTYLAEVRQQFGKGIKVPDEFQWEWLTIPHIFASPFYCYAYSFGNLLVLALYRMYQKEGASFVPKIFGSAEYRRVGIATGHSRKSRSRYGV